MKRGPRQSINMDLEENKEPVLGKRKNRECKDESAEFEKPACPSSHELMGLQMISRECKRQKIKEFHVS